jgi:hypothetical protein
MPGQLEHDRADGMRLDDGVDGPVGAEHEEPRGLTPSRQPGDQVERRVVAPVQILEDEHEGAVGREGLEGIPSLPR